MYRDAQLGLRARLAELEARIREREAEVADVFWTSLDPRELDRLGSMREAIEVLADNGAITHEQLARAETLAAHYLDELETIIARLPTLEEEWRELPEDVPDPPLSTHALDAALAPSERTAFERALRATVHDRDRDAELVLEGASYLVHFRDRGAPFSLRATPHTRGNGQVSEVSMCLHTSVPRALPRLFVRHETLVMAFGRSLGLKREVAVGDYAFDGLFFVEGSRAAVDRLLGPAVRRELLTLSRFDVPTLEVDPPRRLASLKWRFEPQAAALRAAVRVLASIRETQAEVHFRTTG